MGRLLKKMNDFVTVNGNAKLARAVGKSELTIARYLKGEHNPSRQTRYKLARACGCEHEEALEIAQELPEAKGKAS